LISTVTAVVTNITTLKFWPHKFKSKYLNMVGLNAPRIAKMRHYRKMVYSEQIV